MGLVDPGADGSANYLLQGIGVANAFAGSFGKSAFNQRFDVVENVVVFCIGSRANLGANLDSPGGGIDHGKNRYKALLRQNSTVLQVIVGNLADSFAIDIKQTALDCANNLSNAVAQIDYPAIFGQQHPLVAYAGLLGELAVGNQVTVFTVHRHHVLRLQDVVAIQKLAGGSVTRDVHFGIALVHDVGTKFGKRIDHTINSVLVARYQRRGKDYGVAVTNSDFVVEIGHARKHSHRFTL